MSDASIQERMAVVETIVTEIRDNHLPHIQEKLDWHTKLIIGALGTTVLTLIGVLVTLTQK